MSPHTGRISTSLAVAMSMALPLFWTALFLTVPVHATGDASTRFHIYVPPNNDSSARRSLLIVTNVSPSTANVSIVDDAADGDSDDSVPEFSLQQGQSYLLEMAEGTVNDDRGGKADGDFFRILSSQSVIVQMATRSNGQHDWAVSESKSSRGRSFFLYAPPSSGADNDLNVYAYSDNTRIQVLDITTEPNLASGLVDVDIAGGSTVLDVTLHEGEDLIVRENGLGLDVLNPGHTYWILASEGVTVQYGHLGQLTGGNQPSDGAGYVPSANGSSVGSLFYFFIPHNPGLAGKKELRIACYDNSTSIVLAGAQQSDSGWTTLATQGINAGEHSDFVGETNSAFREHSLYRLRVSPPHHRCTVFEGNWMKTGSVGTSDFASAVSGANGTHLSDHFIVYLGPPGRQNQIVQSPLGEASNNASPINGHASHLYVYGTGQPTTVTARDLDTNGLFFLEQFEVPADGYFDLLLDPPTYVDLTGDGRRPYIELLADSPVVVMNGNFNANWMAFFGSTLPPEPRVSLEVSDKEANCNQTIEVSVRCENSEGPNLQALQLQLRLPATMQYETTLEGQAPSQQPGILRWEHGPLAAQTSVTNKVRLRFNCPAGKCPASGAIVLTAECTGQYNGVPYSDVGSQSLALKSTGATVVEQFVAIGVPDYSGNPPEPHVRIEVTLSGGQAGASQVHLLRAVDSGDLEATQEELTSFFPNSVSTAESHQDEYQLHHETTRFYRLKIVEGQCVRHVGPIAVTTSSGSSAGEDSGLEPSGRLANKLARRAIRRWEQLD